MKRVKILGGQNTTGTVSVHSAIPRTLIRTLNHQNFDGASILSPFDLTLEDIQQPEIRVEADLMDRIWRYAVSESNIESLGIIFAQYFRPGSLDGLGFAWAASDSLRDALNRLVRYFRVICTAGEVQLDVNNDDARVWLKIPLEAGIAFSPSIDAALALFVQLCRFARDDDFCVTRIEFQRIKPSDTTEYDNFFNCPIIYKAPENIIVFDISELDKPLPLTNPRLARANDEVVREYLSTFEDQDLASKVRSEIIEMLPSGLPTQDKIATRLFMSTRSLQRKLSGSNTTFSELLDQVRRDLAIQYLDNSHRGIGEISYLLGFTEPTNFARSFKRWTGHTPTEYIESKE